LEKSSQKSKTKKVLKNPETVNGVDFNLIKKIKDSINNLNLEEQEAKLKEKAKETIEKFKDNKG
jgi:hypothetical protein